MSAEHPYSGKRGLETVSTPSRHEEEPSTHANDNPEVLSRAELLARLRFLVAESDQRSAALSHEVREASVMQPVLEPREENVSISPVRKLREILAEIEEGPHHLLLIMDSLKRRTDEEVAHALGFIGTDGRLRVAPKDILYFNSFGQIVLKRAETGKVHVLIDELGQLTPLQ